MNKVSIRFYNDREVRAIWDEERGQWYFSVLDVIGAINEQDDYTKTRNYWKYLKTKLKKEGNELVSVTHQLKLLAPDGKLRLTDTLEHNYLFGGLYDFAGQIRTKTISKGGFTFCLAQCLPQQLELIERMPENSLDEVFDKYVEMNVAHPFMEGNGRSTRIWLDLMLKTRHQCCIDWSKIGKYDYLEAMRQSVADASRIKQLLHQAVTNDTGSRELFMKGIDYSYYYEQED